MKAAVLVGGMEIEPTTVPGSQVPNSEPSYPRVSEPLRFCAADIGSNSIKMRIVEANEQGARRTLAEVRYPIRLGDSFGTGQISTEAIEQTKLAFREIQTLCQSFGVTRTRAVATSAMREAANAAQLSDAVLQATDIRIDVIRGKEEARLLGYGVRPDMKPGHHNLVIDVGGGSTELIYTRTDLTLASILSLRLGAVRLQQMARYGEQVNKKAFQLLKKTVDDTVENANLPAVARDTSVIGVAGTMRALLDAKHRGATAHDNIFTRDELNELLNSLIGLSPAEMERQFGIDRRRAQIIIPGGLIVAGILELYDLRQVFVSGRGLRDGVLDEMIDAAFGLTHLEETAADSATAIGEKYNYPRDHSLHVTHLAISLFDQLRTLHELPAEWREVLRVGSLLHDVGQFISYSKHHKHSYYIILSEEVTGLSTGQLKAAAAIARYHRKALPSDHHPEYTNLPEPAQHAVSLCAGILRIADGLDRQHRQLVKHVRVANDEKQVTLHVDVEEDAMLEIEAASRKSDLFERAFNRKVKIVG